MDWETLNPVIMQFNTKKMPPLGIYKPKQARPVLFFIFFHIILFLIDYYLLQAYCFDILEESVNQALVLGTMFFPPHITNNRFSLALNYIINVNSSIPRPPSQLAFLQLKVGDPALPPTLPRKDHSALSSQVSPLQWPPVKFTRNFKYSPTRLHSPSLSPQVQPSAIHLSARKKSKKKKKYKKKLEEKSNPLQPQFSRNQTSQKNVAPICFNLLL